MKRFVPLALRLGACAMSPSPKVVGELRTGPAGTLRDIEALEARIAAERAAAGLGARPPEKAEAGTTAPAVAPSAAEMTSTLSMPLRARLRFRFTRSRVLGSAAATLPVRPIRRAANNV